VSKLSGGTIKFGATVTLIDEDTDEKKVWRIVGEPEADANRGRISVNSPIARALIGKIKGATVAPWRSWPQAVLRSTESKRWNGLATACGSDKAEIDRQCVHTRVGQN